MPHFPIVQVKSWLALESSRYYCTHTFTFIVIYRFIFGTFMVYAIKEIKIFRNFDISQILSQINIFQKQWNNLVVLV